MNQNSNPFQISQISIDPEYLVEVSKYVEMLSTFYEQEGLGNLSTHYRNALISSFSTLNSKLQIYGDAEAHDTSTMLQASITKCKAELDIFCLEKTGQLMEKQSEGLGKLILSMANNYRNNIESFNQILLSERRRRVEAIENDKDKVINKLKQELLYRKEHIKEMKERQEDLEAENSKMYHKLIGNAKNISQRALSPTSKNLKAFAQIKNNLENTTHKSFSAKQVEQTIHDIMETKVKQQNVKGKKVNLQSYLKTYFRNKFGVKGLAEETQIIFRKELEYFAHSEEKSLFVLFEMMLREQCEEGYFWEQKGLQEKIVRILKRFLNQKYGIQIDEIEKYYEGKIVNERHDFMLSEKDVQYVLMNNYKTTQIESLQQIFNQNISPKLQQDPNNTTSDLTMPSKKLINEILNYQLHRHLLKIEDIMRLIHETDSDRGCLTYEEFQYLLVRLNVPTDKISNNLQLIRSFQNKFITYSQVIENIEKVRKSKGKKK